MHQHHFGEGREMGELMDFGPALAQARRLAGRPHQHGVLAKRHLAGQAIFALAAKGGEAGDDRVPRLYIGHLLADRIDDAGGFMAKHGRVFPGIFAVRHVQIGMADAACSSADADFAGAGFVDLDGFDS